MQTTLRIDDRLYREAKAEAAKEGLSMTKLIEDSIRLRLTRHRKHSAKEKISLPTGHLTVREGVNLDDNRALQDLDDEHDFVRY